MLCASEFYFVKQRESVVLKRISYLIIIISLYDVLLETFQCNNLATRLKTSCLMLLHKRIPSRVDDLAEQALRAPPPIRNMALFEIRKCDASSQLFDTITYDDNAALKFTSQNVGDQSSCTFWRKRKFKKYAEPWNRMGWHKAHFYLPFYYYVVCKYVF